MASNLEFVEYVCQQIGNAGVITYKKMFGEYGIYCDYKIIGLICDNQFFVKRTKKGEEVYPDCELASPYTNAKPHFVVEKIDDQELMTKFIQATYNELPNPKRKKKL